MCCQNFFRIPNVGSIAKLNLRSDGLQENPNIETNHKTRVDFLRTGLEQSKRDNHPREFS